MKKSSEKTKVLESLGWSDSNQSNFFDFNKNHIGDRFKGTFTIKKIKSKWFWYFKFSNDKISPRTKYLCSCDDIGNSKTSFNHATQIFLEKVNISFANKNVIEPNLSKYIDEYIKKCMIDGGLVYKENLKGNSELTSKDDVVRTKNIKTMTRRVRMLSELKEYCIENKIKTIELSKNDFRNTYRDYLTHIKDRKKKNRDGESKSNNKLARSTVKLHLQTIRMFFNWMVEPKDMGGKGLIKQHHITIDYQNYLLKEFYGDPSTHNRIYNDFSLKNYETASEDCIKYIREVWNLYCKYDGDREKIREERLSYNKKMSDGTYSGVIHKNQPKNLIVMGDIVYFISLLQLRYGFRISEILDSYRNVDVWEEHASNKSTQMSSYFRKVEGEGEERDYYILEIKNSKKKDRLVPIVDNIWSWHEPPKNVNSIHIPSKGKVKERWETNIIDVIFEIFYPYEHPKTFPSPNQSEKPNKGYSNTYYLNLFKEKCVNDNQYNWEKYGITTTHNLRSYFVSYMFSKSASIELVCRISGHSYQTAHKFYQRINTKMLKNQLDINSIKNILRK
jgi:hypothetical protein